MAAGLVPFLAICPGDRQPKFSPFWNRASGTNDLYRDEQGSCCPIVGTSIRAFRGLLVCPVHYSMMQPRQRTLSTYQPSQPDPDSSLRSDLPGWRSTETRLGVGVIILTMVCALWHSSTFYHHPGSTNGSDQTGQQWSTSSFTFT